MDEFIHINKFTGVHYLRSKIDDIFVKITIRRKENITLPKFEDFNISCKSEDTQFVRICEEHSFKWQEKVFNAEEILFYSDKNNCRDAYEIHYHQLVKQSAKNNQLFTYINEDQNEFKSAPFETEEIYNSNLESCFQRLNINERMENLLNNDTESRSRLFKSEENIALNSNQWVSMHIMFDYSKASNEDLQTVRQEAQLLSLYWNQSTRCLVLRPDINSLEWNPYTVTTNTGAPLNYEYAVDIKFGDVDDDDELRILLNKLQKKWHKDHRYLLEFESPPIRTKRHYVTVEVHSARDFEMDNLYIEYTVKIPDKVTCKDALRGRTHIAKGTNHKDNYVWNFGYILDFQFDCKIEIESPKIHIFFEVISTDWWGSHRTEGYSHLALSLRPGHNKATLLCMRPEETDWVVAESRRFFIGGCHLLSDLNVLVEPQESMNPNYKFTTTGSITVRSDVICQSSATVGHQPRACSALGLLKTADAVLRQYRHARDRLAAATKDLNFVDYCDE